MLDRIYYFLHRNIKRALKRDSETDLNVFFIVNMNDKLDRLILKNSDDENWFVNKDIITSRQVSLMKSELFYGENVTSEKTTMNFEDFSVNKNVNKVKCDNSEDAWFFMIENCFIPDGWKNSGFCKTGYLLEKGVWCLSSWIWTSAAVARCLIKEKRLFLAKGIADSFLNEQLPCGGWIVRYDYSKKSVVPVIAPNDTAYIANNALLEVYLNTFDEKYLISAEKSADWIINTARDDRLVYFGFDYNSQSWITKYNIVDIGFTAGLFARLFEITHKEKYLFFLDDFCEAYISNFYDYEVGAFATSIDQYGNRKGGFFGRGQAWALEGLIPAFKVLKSEFLEIVIDSVVEYILINQSKDGAWPYNFSRKIMGSDCKGTPVIAKCLLDWNKIKPNERIIKSVVRAISWCKKHTLLEGEASGGIFDSNVEGSVIHNFYSTTAFVYSTAYAIEVLRDLEDYLHD